MQDGRFKPGIEITCRCESTLSTIDLSLDNQLVSVKGTTMSRSVFKVIITDLETMFQRFRRCMWAARLISVRSTKRT